MKAASDKAIQNKIKHTTIENLISVAFQTMIDNTTDLVFVKDINLVYAAASLPFARMAGKETVDEIIYRTDPEIFDDKGLAKRYMEDDRKLLAEGKNLINYPEQLAEDNGRARYGSTSKYILSDRDGNAIGILGITRDITRDYIARQHYQQELKYLFKLPKDTYAVVLIDIDSWRIISQRRQLIGGSTLPSCHTLERLRELELESLVDGDSDAAAFYRKFSPAFLRDIYGSGRSNIDLEYLRRMPEDSVRWVHNDVKFLTDAESGHLCVMLATRDIDAEKREELDLVMAAKMDKMTMLLNRETTMKYIRQVLANEAECHHALFMVDVDNFKSLNDTLGHQAGDEFLIILAKELKKCFRESDIVGRVGGDEFFALMKNISGASAAEHKAEALLEAVRTACAGYPGIPLSGSIGISLYPGDGKTLEELYAQADSALYQAKKKGKDQFIFASL